MKLVGITLLSATTLILSASCSKIDDVKPDESIVRNVCELGSPVTNPTHSEWCKPETAEKTLSSVRHIADNFYKMNFLTDLHLKELEEGNYLTYFDFEQAFSNYMFKPEGTEPIEDPAGTACSGFICRNENGEILLGRNFDGMEGPLMLIYNTVNGYNYVQFTDPFYNSKLYKGETLMQGDGVLSDGKTSLHRLLREPLSTMDGMNEYGLCFGAFQLPALNDTMPRAIKQDAPGKCVISASLMHNLILSRCKTVKEVEDFFAEHNYMSLNRKLNVHWLMADANGDWALFEFWEDKLYVYREKDLFQIAARYGGQIPYEWFSIENYYRNPIPYSQYPNVNSLDLGNWQLQMSSKMRVTHMMNGYKPVMTEMEALQCLQGGAFGIEILNELTDWSCVYNPKQKTVLFALRNDMSKIYKVDLNTDFNKY